MKPTHVMQVNPIEEHFQEGKNQKAQGQGKALTLYPKFKGGWGRQKTQ